MLSGGGGVITEIQCALPQVQSLAQWCAEFGCPKDLQKSEGARLGLTRLQTPSVLAVGETKTCYVRIHTHLLIPPE